MYHQEVRRAAASKSDMEADARESANRAKRLQGQVEMVRSEYEVISEEASSLRGTLAGTEVRHRTVWLVCQGVGVSHCLPRTPFFFVQGARLDRC